MMRINCLDTKKGTSFFALTESLSTDILMTLILMQIYLPFSLCILCVQTMHGIVLGIALQQLRQCYFKVAFAKEAVDRCLSFKEGIVRSLTVRSHLKYAVYGWLNKIQPRSLTRAAGCHL